MPVVSADTLQLAAVPENVPGVTPNNPVFKVWRTTGESLSFSPQTSDSGELGGNSRFQKPSNVTGMSINGDINFELSQFTALENAIQGLFGATWGQCPLTGTAQGALAANRITVGNALKTFTIEKRFPNPAYVSTLTLPGVATTFTVPAATADITITQATATTGTSEVVVDVTTDTGETVHFEVDVEVGFTADQIATAVAAEISKDARFTATATGPKVDVALASGANIQAIVPTAATNQYFYQRYRGATYSAMTLTTSPNNPVTGSVTIVGGVPELSKVPLAGATYTAAGNSPVFTAPEVMALNIGTALGIGTHCWTNLSLTFDSQNRGIPCIGTKGDREVVLGTMRAEVTGDVYFSDQAILEALFANQTVGDGTITFKNASNQVYRFDYYGMKPISGQLAAGGTGQDLTMPLTFQPTPVKVCESASGEAWESGVILSKVNTAPVLP